MSEPFVGEIKMFGGTFAPRGWADCSGQLLAVAQNDALFSLFGTIYGGDGRTTFGLPDLRGRVPIHAGSGPGLTPRAIGAKAGVEQAGAITAQQMPAHNHGGFTASSDNGNNANPATNTVARPTAPDLYINEAPNVAMAAQSVSASDGGGQAHNNIMESSVIRFIVALVGIYPSRN